MADTMEDLARRVDELEQKVRELTERPQKATLGTNSNPISKLFMKDSRTGAVAEVDYDRENSGIRTKEVR